MAQPKERLAVVKFIQFQFCAKSTNPIPDKFSGKRPFRSHQKNPWHYGICELRALLDYIYDGEPLSAEEFLEWPNQPIKKSSIDIQS